MKGCCNEHIDVRKEEGKNQKIEQMNVGKLRLVSMWLVLVSSPLGLKGFELSIPT